MSGHTRPAGLLSNLLAYALLALPLPTHADQTQTLDRPQRTHNSSGSAAAPDASPSRPN